MKKKKNNKKKKEKKKKLIQITDTRLSKSMLVKLDNDRLLFKKLAPEWTRQSRLI